MTNDTDAPEWGNEARNHPLITETDWGFLTTEGYFDDHARPSVSRNQQRRKLRARIRNAFLDLSLLVDYLDSEEITAVLAPDQYDPDEWESLNEQAIMDTLEFLYTGVQRGHRTRRIRDDFEHALIHAVKNAEYDPDGPLRGTLFVDVHLEDDRISVEKPQLPDVDLEKVGEKIDDWETDDLSYAELAYFLGEYRTHPDFEPQFPARMQEGIESFNASEQEDPSDAE